MFGSDRPNCSTDPGSVRPDRPASDDAAAISANFRRPLPHSGRCRVPLLGWCVPGEHVSALSLGRENVSSAPREALVLWWELDRIRAYELSCKGACGRRRRKSRVGGGTAPHVARTQALRQKQAGSAACKPHLVTQRVASSQIYRHSERCGLRPRGIALPPPPPRRSERACFAENRKHMAVVGVAWPAILVARCFHIGVLLPRPLLGTSGAHCQFWRRSPENVCVCVSDLDLPQRPGCLPA